MQLSHILYPSETASQEDLSLDVGKPCMNPLALSRGDVYFATDARHLDEAQKRGACAVVMQEGELTDPFSLPVFRVENVRRQYARAWRRYTGHPDRAIRLIAVTGTNGKTSVAAFLSSLLRAAGYTVGVVGTTECSDGIRSEPSDYTTPPPEILYPLLRRMKENGAEFAVMEASSHALTQERLHGLTFETAIFTNLTRDHLDYHKTKEAYLRAKASLFTQAKRSLLFYEDEAARDVAFASAGEVYYYGENPLTEFTIEHIQTDLSGMRYTLATDRETISVSLPLQGSFHIANSAAALACAYLLGIPADILQKNVRALRAPSGRMEKLSLSAPYSVYIDYAHSPDALRRALTSLRPLCKRLTVLFGAGGERDVGKRPQMGRIAARLADRVILTNDNPRGEDPKKILNEIQNGMEHTENTVCIPNRTEAIEYALRTAQTDEILLFAGKGHENYLIDENGKHPFSEREIVRKYLERKGKDNVFQHP